MPVFKQIQLLVIGLMFCITTISYAQDYGFFEQVWLEEGLSQSSVTAITQDQQGWMWFGTQDGLNRYDGRHIDKFGYQPFNPSSISGDNINGIVPDTLGGIWVLNEVSLDRLNLKTFKSTRITELIQNRGKGRSPVYMIRQLNNRLFAFSVNKVYEIQRKEGETYELITYNIANDSSQKSSFLTSSITADDNNHLYITTNHGIYYCENNTTSFKPFTGQARNGFFQKECYHLFFNNHRLYFSSGSMFYSYHILTGEIHVFECGHSPSSLILCAMRDHLNKIWLGTNGDGLFRLSESEKGVLKLEKHFLEDGHYKYGLTCNVVNYLFQGKDPQEDVVWIGTRDAGAFSYSYSKNSFELISASLDGAPNFFSIAKDKNNIIWAGTNGGIYAIDRATNKKTFIDASPFLQHNPRPVEALYNDDENLWVAIGNVLYKMDKSRLPFTLIPEKQFQGKSNVIVRILAVNDDELMLLSQRGLINYYKKTNNYTLTDTLQVGDSLMPLTFVTSACRDKNENWWIGTNKGLFFINKKTGKNNYFSHHPSDPYSLLSNSIMDIKLHTSGELLIATTKGLSILKNPDTSFENYTSQEGLSNSFIYGLLPDKQGNFWLTTNHGITVFNPETRTFKSYNDKDGVFINEYNSNGFFVASDGELLFGGIGGLVAIYPERQVKNHLAPDVVLRSLMINQIPADSLPGQFPSPVELNYRQNHIYFEFSVPGFAGGGTPRLFYRLKGFTPNWINMGESYSLSLANLAPGNYQLEVKAISPEGVESHRLFKFMITIQPPYWNTWWFYTLLFALLLGTIWMIYYFRLRKKIALIEKMEQVRQEENEKVRKAAALDLHDEFGNGLTRISMLVEVTRMKIPGENKEAHNFLSVISENSSRLYQGTKDFIWSIHPGNDNLYETIIRIKDFGDELFYGTGISFEVAGLTEHYKNIHQLPGTGRNIVMIFKEALSNVLKHSKASKAVLTIEATAGHLALQLMDDGKGIDIAQSKNSFGIANMKQRASRINALITIERVEKGGSIVKLMILNPTSNENTFHK